MTRKRAWAEALWCLQWAQAMGSMDADILEGLQVGAILPQLPGREKWCENIYVDDVPMWVAPSAV